MGQHHKSAVVLLGGTSLVRYRGLAQAARTLGLGLLLLDDDTPVRRARIKRLRSVDADVVSDASLLQTDTIAEAWDAVRNWQHDHAVAGIVCLRENFVERHGVIADGIGTKGPGIKASLVSRDKSLQRRYLAALSPGSRCVYSATELVLYAHGADFPLIVKPPDGMGSMGVTKVNDAAALLALAEADGSLSTLLVEDYQAGEEFSVESIVRDGAVEYEDVTLKRTTSDIGQYCVELGHTTPAPVDHSVSGTLLGLNRKVIESLEVETGIVHAEFRYGKGGRPFLMEVAVRCPGDSILLLHHLATGVPLEERLLRAATGEPAVAIQKARGRIARQVYLRHPPGILRRVSIEPSYADRLRWISDEGIWPDPEPSGATDPGRVHHLVVSASPGDALPVITSSFDRVASFVIDAASAVELDRLEKDVTDSINFGVDQS